MKKIEDELPEESSMFQKLILLGLNNPDGRKHIYGGTVSEKVRQRNRKRNKTARKTRQAARHAKRK